MTEGNCGLDCIEGKKKEKKKVLAGFFLMKESGGTRNIFQRKFLK
jgi:hypothetical protein